MVIADVLLLLGAEILFGRPLPPTALPPYARARAQRENTAPSSVTWQKQAIYGEISKPERISHPVRHKVQQLFADGNSKLTIVGIIAEGIIRPQHMPNGGERLVHRCKRLGIVYVRFGDFERSSGSLPVFAGGSATYLSQPPVPVACNLLMVRYRTRLMRQ